VGFSTQSPASKIKNLIRLKILHVIHSVDPKSGGPSHALYDLAKAQIQQGHEISIIATDRQSGEQWNNPSDYQKTVHRAIPTGLKNLTLIPSYGRKSPWVRYGYSPECRTRIQELLGKNTLTSPSFDFVHVHGLFSQITQKATDICKKLDIPYVVRPTGALDELPMKKGAKHLKKIFLHCCLKKSLENAAFIHATSEKEAESLTQLGLNVTIKLISLGVNFPNWDPEDYQKKFFNTFPILNDKPLVLCLSRIHPIKRLDLAILAFAKLLEKIPNCQLIIAGNPTTHQQELQQLIEDINLSDHIHFIGFLQGDLKEGALFSANAFLQTSEHENFGITVMEALVHGLRVVCTKGVASGKYVESCEGGKITSDEPNAIAADLFNILHNHALAVDLKLAEKVNKKYSWDSVATHLESCYRSFLPKIPTNAENH
jgi:glycosyltransferase involved in cell wall biosynthesis